VMLFTMWKKTGVAMHNVFLVITFAGVVALVFAFLIALEKLIG